MKQYYYPYLFLTFSSNNFCNILLLTFIDKSINTISYTTPYDPVNTRDYINPRGVYVNTFWQDTIHFSKLAYQINCK